MIPLFSVYMNPKVQEEVSKVLLSGFIGEGEKVKQFEKKVQDFVGNNYIATVNSGTSALHLALNLANVSGGKVISTPITCSATNFPIINNNADIVWADIDPKTGNISPEGIKKCLKKHSDIRAIMMVHWGGYPCDIDEINELGRQYSIPVIEDAAHAFGATYKGKRIGNHSDFVMFSFQAIKHLTTVDGGALCCKYEDCFKHAKLLRWFGIDRENTEGRADLRCEADIIQAGFKFHMNDVSATVGLCNFERISAILMLHSYNSEYYDTELKDISGITLLERRSDRESAAWLYTMLVENRDNFMQAMKDRGVMTSKVHARNDEYFCTRNFKTYLPNADYFYSKMVSIPVGAHIGLNDREYIVDCIRKGW